MGGKVVSYVSTFFRDIGPMGKTIGIPPSKFMGGNAIFRSNHLTWEKVPPPLGVGGCLEKSRSNRDLSQNFRSNRQFIFGSKISVKTRFESKTKHPESHEIVFSSVKTMKKCSKFSRAARGYQT